jgi:signal peptidase I
LHSRRVVDENDASSAPPPVAGTPERPGGRLSAFWRDWLRPLLGMALFLTAFRSALADWNDVPTGSMRPTILEGDRVLVDRRAYDLKIPFTRIHLAEWAGPRRGDVVVFVSPESGERLVKRVVGLPGDRIELVGHRLVVNGRAATYSPLAPQRVPGLSAAGALGEGQLFVERLGEENRTVLLSAAPPAGRAFGPVVVPPGGYFMMGDNRDRSHDSRAFGPVPRGHILGRAVGVVLSLDPQRAYRPRLARFFEPLG